MFANIFSSIAAFAGLVGTFLVFILDLPFEIPTFDVESSRNQLIQGGRLDAGLEGRLLLLVARRYRRRLPLRCPRVHAR